MVQHEETRGKSFQRRRNSEYKGPEVQKLLIFLMVHFKSWTREDEAVALKGEIGRKVEKEIKRL